MRIALLAFLGLHVAHALWLNGRQGAAAPDRKNRAGLYLIQVPLSLWPASSPTRTGRWAARC